MIYIYIYIYIYILVILLIYICTPDNAVGPSDLNTQDIRRTGTR